MGRSSSSSTWACSLQTTLPVVVVENQPAGRTVVRVHRPADLHVGVRLVDEPLPVLVHEDRARVLARQRERGPGHFEARSEKPDSLVKVIRLGAERDRGLEQIPGVTWVPDTPPAVVRLGLAGELRA